MYQLSLKESHLYFILMNACILKKNTKVIHQEMRP